METQQFEYDLSVAHKRLAELIKHNEELSDFIENASIPLHWVDANGIIIWANQAELDALGYSKEEYIGSAISDHHADSNVITDILYRLIANETLINYQARLRCKNGSIKHVLISSNVHRKNGEFIHTRCFTKDITEMILEQQRKNDFVAMVSHELKTPLTSILSYIQLTLGRAKKSADQFGIHALGKAELQTKKMTSMINDFLNVSRLEDGKLNIHFEKFSLHVLILETIQEIQLTQDSLNIHYEHCQNVFIYADRAKIGQVISNLLSNAIKYSPADALIVLKCDLQNQQVQVSVQDNGIGISLADQAHLFERFYRVDNNQTNLISGFGIGLYLVSEILRYHKSTIRVQSEPAKGSRFFFTLPVG